MFSEHESIHGVPRGSELQIHWAQTRGIWAVAPCHVCKWHHNKLSRRAVLYQKKCKTAFFLTHSNKLSYISVKCTNTKVIKLINLLNTLKKSGGAELSLKALEKSRKSGTGRNDVPVTILFLFPGWWYIWWWDAVFSCFCAKITEAWSIFYFAPKRNIFESMQENY